MRDPIRYASRQDHLSLSLATVYRPFHKATVVIFIFVFSTPGVGPQRRAMPFAQCVFPFPILFVHRLCSSSNNRRHPPPRARARGNAPLQPGHRSSIIGRVAVVVDQSPSPTNRQTRRRRARPPPSFFFFQIIDSDRACCQPLVGRRYTLYCSLRLHRSVRGRQWGARRPRPTSVRPFVFPQSSSTKTLALFSRHSISLRRAHRSTYGPHTRLRGPCAGASDGGMTVRKSCKPGWLSSCSS